MYFSFAVSHTETLTLDLHAKFPTLRAKPVATKEQGVSVDRPANGLTNLPAERPIELLVAANKIISISEANTHTSCGAD